MVDLQAAYASCLRDARRHYENFPVASLLIPRGMQPHVAAVYAFARAADDFADEGDRLPEERERLLDSWRHRLRSAAASTAPGRAPEGGEPRNTVEIFLALGATIRQAALPLVLFEDLLNAFRQDVRVTRYETWEDLLDYCRRSANPVGRLVLRIAGHDDARLDAWSDAICTALQLTNFWQDVGIDAGRGRIYLPAAERRAHGADEGALSGGRITEGWRRALRAAAVRTCTLFEEGRPLCDVVGGRLRWELRATWLGGMRVLARLDAVEYDVFRRRPSLGMRDAAWFAWRLASWRGGAGALHAASSPIGPPEQMDGRHR